MRQNLISKMQKIVKSQSVNSLGNVYPDEIIEWLDISGVEAKELINELHEERIVSYKYKLKCSCGEICTIYEKKLIHNPNAYCEICGREISLDDIKEKAYIVYEINKKELLDLGQENVDFKELPNIKGKVVPISRRPEEKQWKYL